MSSRFPIGVATTYNVPATTPRYRSAVNICNTVSLYGNQPCYADSVSVDSSDEYYTWKPLTNQPHTIRLHVTAINNVNAEVMRGFAATRRRGTEPGGLLLGRYEPSADPVITIDDVEVIPCEYSQGPSYILSAGDLSRFREAVQ